MTVPARGRKPHKTQRTLISDVTGCPVHQLKVTRRSISSRCRGGCGDTRYHRLTMSISVRSFHFCKHELLASRSLSWVSLLRNYVSMNARVNPVEDLPADQQKERVKNSDSSSTLSSNPNSGPSLSLNLSSNSNSTHSRIEVEPEKQKSRKHLKTYAEFKSYAHPSAKSAIKWLRDFLLCSHQCSVDIIQRYPKFRKCSKLHLDENLLALKKYGIGFSTIKHNIWLLCENGGELTRKIHLLSSLDLDVNDTATFAAYPEQEVRAIFEVLRDDQNCCSGNRVRLLSKKLQVSHLEICNILNENPNLFEIPYEMLYKTIDFMLGIGIPPDSILRNIKYMDRKTVSVYEKRYLFLQEHGIFRRCAKQLLHSNLYTRCPWEEVPTDKKLILQYLTAEAYICDRLNVDEETAKRFLRDSGLQQNARIKCIAEKLDLLLDRYGYAAEDILHTPRVLCLSYKLLEKRMEELHGAGFRPKRLYYVTRATSNFGIKESFRHELEEIKEN